MRGIENYIRNILKKRPLYFVLIDPDKGEIVDEMKDVPYADGFLVGGSSDDKINIDKVAKKIKNKFPNIPLILFPGTFRQITKYADAILFMSLVSGRNPQFLIEEQVKGAPHVKKYNIEVLPTAYILIDGGKVTSVQKISNTIPLTPDNKQLVINHAMAAFFLGMRFIYLEAGSGALNPVHPNLIKSVRDNLPEAILIVGGGIREEFSLKNALKSGADIVVTGTMFEKDPEKALTFYNIVKSWKK